MDAKTFRQLERREQLRRLRELARAALKAYDLGNVRLVLTHYGANAIYRVEQTRDRKRFVLRLHAPHTPAAYIRSELAWLDALHSEGFTVPGAIRRRDGDVVTTVPLPEFSERRGTTLLTWIEGRAIPKRRTPEMLRRIGREIARLHEHAAQRGAPQQFKRPRWDPPSLRKSDAWCRLTAQQTDLFAEVAERFTSAARDLGAGSRAFGVIHGDFTFDNLLAHRAEVRVIDFDDCGSGYYLYDLATLIDRIEWREDYGALRTALIAGYREERPLAAEHEMLLDLFLLVRWVFLGLAFLSAPELSPGRLYSARFLDAVLPKMRMYLSRMR